MKFALTGSLAVFRRIMLWSARLRAGKGSAGFSLLETLTALTILAISLTTLMNAYTDSLRNAERSQNNIKARLLAQTLLTEAKANLPEETTQKTGRNAPFTWSVSYEIVDRTTPGKKKSARQFYLVQINISVQFHGSEIVSLKSIKLGELT